MRKACSCGFYGGQDLIQESQKTDYEIAVWISLGAIGQAQLGERSANHKQEKKGSLPAQRQGHHAPVLDEELLMELLGLTARGT